MTMDQHEATQKAKEAFGERAFTYAKWTSNPPEFIVGSFAIHEGAEQSPMRGRTWEEAFSVSRS
jgi:hypothetical protein